MFFRPEQFVFNFGVPIYFFCLSLESIKLKFWLCLLKTQVLTTNARLMLELTTPCPSKLFDFSCI